MLMTSSTEDSSISDHPEEESLEWEWTVDASSPSSFPPADSPTSVPEEAGSEWDWEYVTGANGTAKSEASHEDQSLESPSSDAVALSAVSVLAVVFLSPLILCSNALLLTALHRFKRLRTPANYLVVSLAAADVGIGLFLPAGLYLELALQPLPTGPGSGTLCSLCVLPFCVALALVSVSLLSMAAIALDRFTSLAQPLRYNNLVTHTSAQRHVLVLWVCSLLAGFSPLLHSGCQQSPPPTHCSSTVLDLNLLGVLFLLVHGPCAAILLGCYAYIYVVARGHARAIHSVQVALMRQHQGQPSGPGGGGGGPGGRAGDHARYSHTLAVTVGAFLCLWMPSQVALLSDVMAHTALLAARWSRLVLGLLLAANSAANPWVYGFRNSELRFAVLRLLKELLTKLGLPHSYCSCRATNATEMNSYASNVRLWTGPGATASAVAAAAAAHAHGQSAGAGAPGRHALTTLYVRASRDDSEGAMAQETIFETELSDAEDKSSRQALLLD